MSPKKIKYGAYLSSLTLLAPCLTYADLTTVPATVDPGRIVQRYLTPPPLAKVTPPAAPVPERRAIKARIRNFRLRRVEFVGNTLLTSAELGAAFQPRIGTIVTSNDLQDMSNKILERYNQLGYTLADTNMSVSRGVLIVRVYEGYIDQVRVVGNIPPSTACLIRSYGLNAACQRPVHLSRLVRYALLVNDLPGIGAQGVLAPSNTIPGATDLTYVVNRKPVYAYISLDNRGTRALGPEEILFGIYANSWYGGNQTGMQGTVTLDGRELKFLQFSHQQYIGNDGLNIFAHIAGVNTRPGSIFEPFDLTGRSRWGGITLSYPCLRSAEKSLWVHGTFDALNSTSHEGDIDLRLYDDRIRSLRLGATYEADFWKGHNLVDAQFSKGLNILGASDSMPSIVNGKADYTKVVASFSHNHPLQNNFSIFAAVRGQYSPDTLLAPEQIGFGGTIYGRGYDPSEIVGDRGLEGKVELRYVMYPKAIVNYVQLYALYDAGIVWNNNSTQQFVFSGGNISTTGGRLSATSAGFGTRFNFSKHFSGNLELDFPLTRKVLLENNKNPRAYFGITAYL